MKTTVQAIPTESQPKQSVPLTPAAQNAWAVAFKTPAPEAMPSERLKARAELVRKALSTGTY